MASLVPILLTLSPTQLPPQPLLPMWYLSSKPFLKLSPLPKRPKPLLKPKPRPKLRPKQKPKHKPLQKPLPLKPLLPKVPPAKARALATAKAQAGIVMAAVVMVMAAAVATATRKAA